MKIIKADETHIPGILKLLLQVNQVHADGRPDLFKSGGIKYTENEVAQKLARPEETIFVAEEDGAVLGYVFGVEERTEETTSVYAKKTLYIDDLCVDEVCRGKGVGKALYTFIRAYAKDAGYDRITLHVWECNPNAKKFYEAVGLKPMYAAMEAVL